MITNTYLPSNLCDTGWLILCATPKFPNVPESRKKQSPEQATPQKMAESPTLVTRDSNSKNRSTSLTLADFSAIRHLREVYFHILRISALQSFALRHMKHGWEYLLETVHYVQLEDNFHKTFVLMLELLLQSFSLEGDQWFIDPFYQVTRSLCALTSPA